MSVALARQVIQRFLSDKTAEVLCFKGKWGTGKSHTWNEMLERAAADGSLAWENYAHVSLFGLTSLDQLKAAIFENTLPRRLIGSQPTVSTALDRITAFARKNATTGTAVLKSAPGLGKFVEAAEPIVQSLSFLSVRDQLICFDDLERKGAGLSVRDVLGLANHLKEHKACKVVIIYNEEGFSDQEKKELDRFFEKVSDSHIRFAPTAEESAEIGFKANDDIDKQLREFSSKLGISNIRVLRRIKRLASLLLPVMDGMHREAKRKALHSLTLLTWAKLGEEDGILDYIKKRYSIHGFDKKPENDKEKEWDALLTLYDYERYSSLDGKLLEGIDKGYFDGSDLEHHLREIDALYKEHEGREEITRIWRMFRLSFKVNDKEFGDGLIASARRYPRYIDPTSLQTTVQYLRALGRSVEATELITFYTRSRTDPAVFDTSQPYGDRPITDPEIKAAFEIRYAEFVTVPSLRDRFIEASKSPYLEEKDRAIFKDISADELFEIFAGEDGKDHLPDLAKLSLSVANEAATVALKRIAQMSPLNRLKVKRFGVEVDGTDGTAD